jgi:hypothetical protein
MTTTRPRDETTEEKKARKQAVKKERQVCPDGCGTLYAHSLLRREGRRRRIQRTYFQRKEGNKARLCRYEKRRVFASFDQYPSQFDSCFPFHSSRRFVGASSHHHALYDVSSSSSCRYRSFFLEWKPTLSIKRSTNQRSEISGRQTYRHRNR